jgi:lysophospholipase L1-like esterase
MEKKKTQLLIVALVTLLAASATAATLILSAENAPFPNAIRVACVGDSLTQSTEYPFDLWNLLGQGYTVENFGAGSTTVLLSSETPYVTAIDSRTNKSVLRSALDFEPDIVIIMLGTNDAQPGLKPLNTSFVNDYIRLISDFQRLASKPQIWVVLPPQIFSNNTDIIDGQYFASTLIPAIELAANQTSVPTIDVFSLLDSPSYFKADGEHINSQGAQILAETVYRAITQKP